MAFRFHFGNRPPDSEEETRLQRRCWDAVPHDVGEKVKRGPHGWSWGVHGAEGTPPLIFL